MPNIDWTKPIETVPCTRNPVSVSCTFAEFHGSDAKCWLDGEWFDGDNVNRGCDNWFFQITSADPCVDWLPTLRNVAESSV